jgi:hypothetical protein
MPRLDAAEFRRRLAFQEDTQANADYSPELQREKAADFVCALALVFNRKVLDAKTLWSRIGSAVETGVVAARGGDLERFEHHCLCHVKASVSLVAASEDYARLTARLRQLDDDGRLHFIRYLSEHLYPAVIFGRAKWEERKAELEKARKSLADLEAEGGAE